MGTIDGADPFAVLGVARGASDHEITRAFRRLALLHHPDRNPGDSDAVVRFRRVKQAYDAVRERSQWVGASASRSHTAAPKAPPTTRSEGPTPRHPRATAGGPADSRTVDPPAIEQLRPHLAKLVTALEAVVAKPGAETRSAARDALRWARLHVDLALAFKGHVSPLRDQAWTALRFSREQEALRILSQLRDSVAILSRFDLVELRNLRARVEGGLKVVDGWIAADAG